MKPLTLGIASQNMLLSLSLVELVLRIAPQELQEDIKV
jgi:hypothetical protein